MRKVIAKFSLAVSAALAIGLGAASFVHAQQKVAGGTLTAADYIEIQQLVARYGYAVDTHADNGYGYADLFTADGVFGNTKGREALKPGGAFVLHEYAHYQTWRYAPHSPAIEKFVRDVESTWRASGGEPNVGLELQSWLHEDGFDIRSSEIVTHVTDRDSYVWQWANAFLTTAPQRMVSQGHMTEAEASAIAREHAALEANPHAVLMTPSVLEIIAVRR